MADVTSLNAEPRTQKGKSTARSLRRDGKIPAIIYGDKQDPVSIILERKVLTKIYQTGRLMSTLLDIDIEGKKNRVIARDIQLDSVKDIILHADFLRLGKGAKIAVEIPVNFLNEDICPGIKRGGVLNVVRYMVELLCPADNIPERIEIDLAEADIGASLHISNVALPEGVTPTITDRDFTIATIATPAGLTEEEEEKAEEVEGEEGVEGEEAAEDKEKAEDEGEKKADKDKKSDKGDKESGKE